MRMRACCSLAKCREAENLIGIAPVLSRIGEIHMVSKKSEKHRPSTRPTKPYCSRDTLSKNCLYVIDQH